MPGCVSNAMHVPAIPCQICCHSSRASGIANDLTNGGTLEKAQRMPCDGWAETTKLYDRREDELTLDDVERIVI